MFSSEGDGMGHVFMDFSRYEQKRLANKIHLPFDPEAKRQEEAQAIEERFASFIKLSKTPKQVDWSNKRDSLTGVHITDITIPILKALAGFDTMRIVASRPNGGAVTGFPDNAALEYTMDLYTMEWSLHSYFWALCFIPLVYMFVFILVLYIYIAPEKPTKTIGECRILLLLFFDKW